MPVGTQAPFGAARVSPDTIIDKIRIPFDNFGGYNYWDNQILAFSHTHMVLFLVFTLRYIEICFLIFVIVWLCRLALVWLTWVLLV
jgi:hypothetical protein